MTERLSEIARLLGTSVSDSVDRDIRELLTDSRSLILPDQTLFFALSANADGKRFIPELYRRGVRAFVVDRVPEEMRGIADAAFIVVDDTLRALQTVGARHRNRNTRVVAITGSRGKTWLKEWLFLLMEPWRRIVRSPRSYNSRIGVPLSLWEINPDTELAIIEAGISRKGEMKPLADLIQPDTVIITNISDDHDEGFSDRRQKAEEKALIASPESVGVVIYDADSELISESVAPYLAGKRAIGWSRKNPDSPLFIESCDKSGGITEIVYVYGGERHKASIHLTSDAEIENAIHAMAFMLSEGTEPEEIARRLKMLKPVDARLDVYEGVNGCSLIFDGLPSDVSSLRPTLQFMMRRAAPGLPRTAIISDLHHESSSASEVYREAARLLSHTGVTRIIGIGKEISEYSSEFGAGAEMYVSTDQFLAHHSPSDFAREMILIKGSPEFGFPTILEMLEARKHETVLEVNLDSIGKNFNYFRSLLPAGVGLIGMVKAGGYGAGSFEVAKTLQDRGAAYLAVAVLDEGIALRNSGITMPIMVMNPKVVNYKSMFSYRLEPEIYSFEMLEDVIREAGKNGVECYPVHIKLDTGMHRMGFEENEIEKLMDRLLSQESVEVRSVFSHLATADCPDMDDYTLQQLGSFERASSYMLSRSRKPFLRHVLNSAGIVRFPQYHYDMARLGIGLYGVRTLPAEIEGPLAPVSALRTVIISIRERRPGDTIGYGRRGVVEKSSRIATIPIGYADGMNRHFGNGAVSVKVNGKEAPTIGNICMDACMIDVTGIDCKVGDSVEIFGPEMNVQRLADVLDTIPYEVITSVSPRVKRVYFGR